MVLLFAGVIEDADVPTVSQCATQSIGRFETVLGGGVGLAAAQLLAAFATCWSGVIRQSFG